MRKRDYYDSTRRNSIYARKDVSRHLFCIILWWTKAGKATHKAKRLKKREERTKCKGSWLFSFQLQEYWLGQLPRNPNHVCEGYTLKNVFWSSRLNSSKEVYVTSSNFWISLANIKQSKTAHESALRYVISMEVFESNLRYVLLFLGKDSLRTQRGLLPLVIWMWAFTNLVGFAREVVVSSSLRMTVLRGRTWMSCLSHEVEAPLGQSGWPLDTHPCSWMTPGGRGRANYILFLLDFSRPLLYKGYGNLN